MDLLEIESRLRRLSERLEAETRRPTAVPASPDQEYDQRQARNFKATHDAREAGLLLLEAVQLGFGADDEQLQEVVARWGDKPHSLFMAWAQYCERMVSGNQHEVGYAFVDRITTLADRIQGEASTGDDDENWSEADRSGQFLKQVKHKLKRTTFYGYLKDKTIRNRPAGKGYIQVWLPDFNKFK